MSSIVPPAALADALHRWIANDYLAGQAGDVTLAKLLRQDDAHTLANAFLGLTAALPALLQAIEECDHATEWAVGTVEMEPREENILERARDKVKAAAKCVEVLLPAGPAGQGEQTK